MATGTIFFDYDGTLHDTMALYGPAFRKAYQSLVDQGQCKPEEFTDEFIASWLGWTIRDMWTTFRPELPEEVWRPASKVVGAEMSRLMDEGKARLFAGVPAMLDKLKGKGYGLVLLSNCACSYRDAHRAQFSLDKWFDAYHVAEEFPGLAKWEIYQKVAAEYPDPHVMVGDRFHDLDVAKHANIPFVGCRFGFGDPAELAQADVVVSNPEQVPEAIRQVLSA